MGIVGSCLMAPRPKQGCYILYTGLAGSSDDLGIAVAVQILGLVLPAPAVVLLVLGLILPNLNLVLSDSQ